MFKRNYKLWLVMFCLIFLSFFVGRHSVPKSNIPDNSQAKPNIEAEAAKESFLGTGLSFSKYFVHIDRDKILFTTFEGMGNYAGGELKKENYPRLFETYSAGTNFIKVNEIQDKKHNKTFSFVSNNVFSHGAYVETYGLIFDPELGTVVYESPEILKSSSLASLNYVESDGVMILNTYPYYFYASCTACKLPVIDYQAYDPKEQKFISANKTYKKDFEKLLVEYNDIAARKCEIDGKVVDVDELLKSKSPDTKCDNTDLPGKPDGNKDFYTIGQFDALRQKIKSIVNGENLSLVN